MNAINWFEIPVANLDRAVAFYEKTLAVSLHQELFGGTPMAIFKAEGDAVGGALIASPHRKPNADGPIVYLNVAGKLDEVLARVAKAQVVTGKTDIGEPGFIAMIRDTEGNVVGLHSPR